MLGRREFIDRLAKAVAGTMLGAALAWRVPTVEQGPAEVIAAFAKETDFRLVEEVCDGSWVCNAKRLEEMRAVFSGPDDDGSLWLFGSPLIVTEHAPDGGPYWVPNYHGFYDMPLKQILQNI